MKKSCLLFALSLFAESALFAQNDSEIPHTIPVGMVPDVSMVVPDFRPVGWSIDGKFAWIEVLHIEGRGGEDITYTIVDAVDNAFVWQNLDNRSWEEAEDGSALDISWNRTRAEFSKQLAANNIEHESGILIQPFPLVSSGENYHIDVQIGEEKEPTFYDTVGSYSVTVTRKGHGKRTITSVAEVTALGVRVVGYIESPFESLIMVVVAEEIAGWEGPPNRIDLTLYGCNLLVGFR